MFDFAGFLNLPLIWYGLIAIAIILYVILDGFGLGMGILFPFAPTDQSRDRMMNSIAPVWDSNETWLVLGGGGLFAAFPLAYAVLMPALYIPIIIMLLGLIFRGVSFEFRFKAEGKSRSLWDLTFHVGSLTAALMQGMIIGAYVQGFAVEGRSFAGGAFDWLNAYSVMTGVAVVCGYGLLGATWLVMKTDDTTQEWARKTAAYVMWYVAVFMGLVSISMPMMNPDIRALWFDYPNYLMLMPVPLLTAGCFILLWVDLRKEREKRPFFLAIGIFLLGYLGIGISLWPYIVPFAISIRDAAAAPTSQSLLLVGAVIMLPVMLAYIGYCYYVFRGKISHEPYY
jgi:cytochrome d ubiquinol oxidase subunit II